MVGWSLFLFFTNYVLTGGSILEPITLLKDVESTVDGGSESIPNLVP